jgi:hypothetical protein
MSVEEPEVCDREIRDTTEQLVAEEHELWLRTAGRAPHAALLRSADVVEHHER